jgi:aryl-alcohol dehydrogenase-like predicted oxidoreductase
MEYRKLGSTGLEVSRICLGCLTYGAPSAGKHGWTMDEEASRPVLRAAVEAGINFFDTADSYSGGTSEEIVGRALKEYARREEIAIATKVCRAVRTGPNGAGLSRKAVMNGIDGSLKRLGTDYVDLYQIHRWDSTTPIEETLDALNDVVRMGKALYIGASGMYAWQFMKALSVSRINGWAEFVSMQNHLNLLAREEETEMLPLCADQGIAVIPYSPLARGRLSRGWEEGSKRQASDANAVTRYTRQSEASQEIVKRVSEIAESRGVARAQIALAWLLQKPQVTAPVVGIAKPQHLSDAVSALSVTLTPDEVRRLEEPYRPQGVASFQ